MFQGPVPRSNLSAKVNIMPNFRLIKTVVALSSLCETGPVKYVIHICEVT